MAVAAETRGRGVFAGLATLDIVQRIPAMPVQNTKITADWQAAAGGGPALNAAVAFAALGGASRLLTGVGGGPIAALIAADLQAQQVDLIDLAPVEASPAVSTIMLHSGSGERTVISSDAGQLVIDPPDLAGYLAGAAVVLIDGHHPALALAAAAAARQAEVRIVVDAGRWKPVMEQLLPVADVVICSSDFRRPEMTSAETASWLVELGVPNVAVTAGSTPVRWWQKGSSGEVPVPQVDAVDTLGAGDVFHGAFCWAVSQPGGDFLSALGTAARAASLRCGILGPRAWTQQLRQAAGFSEAAQSSRSAPAQ